MGGREERDGGGGGERRRWGARFYFLAAVKWGPGRRRPRPPRRVAFSWDDRASGGGGDHLEMRRVERRQRLQIDRGERGRGQRRARVEGRARAGAQKGRMDAEGSNGSAGDGAARTESTRAGRKHDRISHRSSYPHPSRRRVRSRCPAMARTRCAQSCVADAWLPFKKWFPPRPELAPTVVPRAPERANRDPPSFTDARVTLPELHRARIRCDRDTRDATRCCLTFRRGSRRKKAAKTAAVLRSIYPKIRRSIRFS